MAGSTRERQQEEFNTLYDHLRTFRPPLLHPPKTMDPALVDRISSMQLHSCLESCLHILNYDLVSAHFLVRKMQSLPAAEGMMLHAVLHRIEGDYENSKAWYSDVDDTSVMKHVWGENSGSTAKSFVDMIQRLDNRVKSSGEGDYGKGAEKEQTTLEQESRREIDGVVEWCLQEFGTGRVFDATTCWVKPNEKVKQAGQDQTTGEGSGLREF